MSCVFQSKEVHRTNDYLVTFIMQLLLKLEYHGSVFVYGNYSNFNIFFLLTSMLLLHFPIFILYFLGGICMFIFSFFRASLTITRNRLTKGTLSGSI